MQFWTGFTTLSARPTFPKQSWLKFDENNLYYQMFDEIALIFHLALGTIKFYKKSFPIATSMEVERTPEKRCIGWL